MNAQTVNGLVDAVVMVCACKQGPIEKPIVNIFTASCSQKENKCKPMRTVRGQRLVLNLAVIVFTFGIVAYILTSQDTNKAFVNPGPLTSHHSTIQGQNCQTCHDLKGHESWLGAAFSEHSSMDDSKKCLACHQFNSKEHHTDNLDLAALNPHSVTDGKNFGASASKFKEEKACMTCHSEHRGYNIDMKTMSNERCQSCHEDAFHSFADGHPEFQLYPYKSENYVNFSHRTHDKYFKEANRKDLIGDSSCTKCHTDNPDQGNTIKAVTFESVCSDCHSVPFDNVPIKLFALSNPLKETAAKGAYKDSSFKVGQVEGLNSPQLLNYFNDKMNLFNIANGDLADQIGKMTYDKGDDVKNQAGAVAGEWNDLLYLLEAKKQGVSIFKALQWSIASKALSIDEKLNKNSLKKDKDGLMKTLLADAEIKKNLQLAILAYGSKADEASFNSSLQLSSMKKFMEDMVSLFPDDVKKFVPTDLTENDKNSLIIKHLAANKKLSAATLSKINKILGKKASTIQKYLKAIGVPAASSSVGYTSFYSKFEKFVKKKPELVKKFQENFNNPLPVFIADCLPDKDVAKYVVKLLDRKIQKKITTKTPAAEAMELLKPYEIMIQLNFAYIIDAMAAPSKSAKPTIPKVEPPSVSAPAESNKWKIETDEDGHKYAVYTTVPFHASPMMVKAYSNNAFKNPLEGKGPADCMMCHSRINSDRINHWKTPITKKSLTKFSHVPHGSKCSSCHKFKEDNEPSLAGFDNYHKDYRPMQKADCIQCHKPDGAGDSCLKCHNYHAMDFAEQKGSILKLIESFKKKKE